ncbi:MAG: FliI/YscN family ATPase [Deltaproteobacteria bacterium]|nr:FliI/YscN family ATPase [Candidatus Anaeroferrophillus wilburensis]MBN2888486.1 FliI/YscN family ATPase [Deltaproteobacteria bacterium]
MIDFDQLISRVQKTQVMKSTGQVVGMSGLIIEGSGPPSSVGDVCEIINEKSGVRIIAEVVGFRNQRILLMPLGDRQGIAPGSTIVSRGQRATTRVGARLLGRVIDGMGNPLDNHGPLECHEEVPIYQDPLNPFERKRIQEVLDLGIRSINALLSCGKGQRLGIMAGSGVGKSVLLGMMARYTKADVNVIALIGERGREVREFIERDLGLDGLARSVVVVATSDQPPLVRMRGAFLATAIAEFFREKNRDVLLMMDSLTRFAMAQREVGLAVGEPPTTKGYTPSVFALLPKLLERAGRSKSDGSITGLYTVLVEGDDVTEPIADAARSILDGHIVLSRQLADRNMYPAIDVLASKSRVMIDVVTREHMQAAGNFLSLLATYQEAEDLINIGAYAHGSNQRIDQAILLHDAMLSFLCQAVEDQVSFADSSAALVEVLQSL